MLRLHQSLPVLSVVLRICHCAVEGSFKHALIGDLIGLPTPIVGRNLSFETTTYGASRVDTLFQFNADVNGAAIQSAAVNQYAGEACPSYNVVGSGMDIRLLKTQVVYIAASLACRCPLLAYYMSTWSVQFGTPNVCAKRERSRDRMAAGPVQQGLQNI